MDNKFQIFFSFSFFYLFVHFVSVCLKIFKNNDEEKKKKFLKNEPDINSIDSIEFYRRKQKQKQKEK